MVEALLKRARDRAGSTARLAEVAGVPYGTLSDWVNGEIPGAMVALYRISSWMEESLGEEGALRRRVLEVESRLAERTAFYEGIIRKLTTGEHISSIQDLGYTDGTPVINDPDADSGLTMGQQPVVDDEKDRRKRGAG